MFLNKPKSLLYLTRSGFTFYGNNTAKGLQFSAPHNVVNDLEIVDAAKLALLLEEWLKENKLRPTSAAMALSAEVMFVKEFSPITPASEVEIRTFLEEVPFDNDEFAYVSINSKKKISIFATNQALYLGIKNILEEKHWRVPIVCPNLLNEPIALNWRKVLAAAVAQKKENFLLPKNINKVFAVPSAIKTSGATKRVKILLAILGLTFVFALIFIYLKYK